MPSLCCFWCPAKDYHERAPGETCPTCGREYEAPLKHAPSSIGDYQVEAPISRGFYSAVYRARQRSLSRTVVLKVVPIGVYTFFGKDWAGECAEHASIAEGTGFVANIHTQFDADVSFGDARLRCHVAVLENIDGPTLASVFREPGTHGLGPRSYVQIASDLFETLHVFTSHQRSHNDLHAGNIIVRRLTPRTQRSGAIEPMIRAVAIDLGSMLDHSQSDATRLGDQHQIARHMAELAKLVRGDGNARTDTDNRIAGALRGLAEHLAPEAGAQRIMSVEDAQQNLREAMVTVEEPWRRQLKLQRFGDAYNAQSLESWHVPELWFDPDGKWFAKTTARGPLVITGMRGCGKTILLRALHLHARAAVAERKVGKDMALPEVRKDHFIGIYASCQKLLNPLDHDRTGAGASSRPFERLYVAYLIDAVQVLKHLRSLDPTSLLSSIDVLLADAMQMLDVPGWRVPSGEQAFQRALTDLQFGLADGTAQCALKGAPAVAFGHLAKVIQSASPSLDGKYVLFLLDDVSTRYLDQDVVRRVISQLLFQHPSCAFKITTETQALQRVVLSPGGSTPADASRDYEEFDLGNEVYRLLKDGSISDRVNFVSEILKRRGLHFDEPLYKLDPVDVLGDVKLETVAQEIATSAASSPARKRVYRGVRALQAVCVGDLGDVVKLYEKILSIADRQRLPVPPEKQSDCFLEHSASLMHFLNRRDQHKKGLALAFAQAAGELLKRSGEVAGGERPARLRQYTKLYVRVDAGPQYSEVVNRILDLLDAGVFVYDGGAPRTKTRDSDPVLQFKLSFRKMLGLASFIGVSDRDRFELSGETLRTFLEHPDRAKTILLESESRKLEARGPDPSPEEEPEAALLPAPAGADVRDPLLQPGKPKSTSAEAAMVNAQLDLFRKEKPNAQAHTRPQAPSLGLSVDETSLAAWNDHGVDTVVLALGFEERTAASARRILEIVQPRRTLLVEYGEGDQGAEIKALVRERRIPAETVRSIKELSRALAGSGPKVLVDTSGLSKPFLFTAVRDVLATARRVGVVHTMAEHHYPRNEQLASMGISTDQILSEKILKGDVFGKLENVLMGEEGPYRLVRVHHAPADPERWRTLLASASPKNDRLLHLLDQRDYDSTRIFVPPPTSPRRIVARAAADLASSVAGANVSLVEIETNDIARAMKVAEEIYNDLYYRSGANVEVGLTGSKMHAVAFAALAASARVSEAWYVVPGRFDQKRFTEGVGPTKCFELTLK